MSTALPRRALAPAAHTTPWTLLSGGGKGRRRSPGERRLVKTLYFMEETFGSPLLEAKDADDLADRLDETVRDPGFHHGLALVTADTLRLSRQPIDPDAFDAADVAAIFGRAQVPTFRRCARLLAALADASDALLADEVVAEAAAVHQVDHGDPLRFIYRWELPHEITGGLLDMLFHWACGFAVARARATGERLAPRLAKGLLTRWHDGLYGHLRLLASMPGSKVPEALVPSADRCDLDEAMRRHRALMARFDAAARESAATGEPVHVFGEPIFDEPAT